ncbi:MAG: Gfo/Idh/MocA family oxidoreductase [Erysipelotrichaceae bacterium]|nr:Gfo/Idh/MocA family oxidoreductase [Erysipelotrichaceae bacterium]
MKLVIFGCGKIAKRIAKACLQVKEIELLGFASKDIDKARNYAKTYGCKEYGDYEYFLNGDTDAVYVATHNPSHYEVIRACLEHHKSVICEKPMLGSIRDTEELFDLAKKNGVTLMEAMKSVFLPLNHRIKELMHNGTIGEIREVYAAFMRNGTHPADHWINEPVSGGALKDLGSYCVGTLNFLMDEKPQLLSLETDRTPGRADTTAYADLNYGKVKGKIAVSNRLDGDTTLIITGSRGMIRADNYWKTGKGYYIVDGIRHELEEECISDFYYELEHFAGLVERGIPESPIMSRQASLNILSITAKETEEKNV